MSTADELIAEYDASLSKYESFRSMVVGAILQSLSDSAVEYFSIQSRVKSREAVVAKLVTNTVKRLPTDVVGVRLLCYFQEDIPVLVNRLMQRLVVENLAESLSPEQPHGMLHMQVSLPSRAGVRTLSAELQIRTILQQAHLEVSHALGYDSEPSLARRASRIAGLVELYDNEISQLRGDLLARNLHSTNAGSLRTPLQTAVVVNARVSALAEEFRGLLGATHREERLQQFLAAHPEFLYPEYVTSFPKMKLGDQWITDFVLRVHGAEGAEYVFVEIEQPTKSIFTANGQFSAEFTQAKDQLLNWERWIDRNIAYLREKLPDLYKPQFHLIMGRDSSMSHEQRDKLKSEFAGTRRRFSTYDDVLTRFETIVGRLLGGA